MIRSMQRTTQESAEPLIDPEALAEILQVSVRQVVKLAGEGRIPSYRIGSMYRFRADEVLEAIRLGPAIVVAEGTA